MPLNATISPPTSATYAWSTTAGPGDGFFQPANSQNTQFRGTVRGEVTVQVTANAATGAVCSSSAELVVIEINDLAEPVTPQFMDEFQTSQYTIP